MTPPDVEPPEPHQPADAFERTVHEVLTALGVGLTVIVAIYLITLMMPAGVQ